MRRRFARLNDNPELRELYRAANPRCELSPLLKRLGMIHAAHVGRIELHHVVGGSGGRLDLWSNLICLSPQIHRWVESEPSLGRTLCLIAKAAKSPSEIDADEFRRCSGQILAGWLANHEPKDKRVRPAWEQLVTLCEAL